MATHLKFMKAALKVAAQGVSKGQSPFGACIVKNGKVIACAHNTVWQNRDITAHAEIQALRLACKKLNAVDLSGCVIYSTCEPCPMCFSACHWAKIKQIVFGVSIRDAKLLGFSELTISNKKMKRLGRSKMAVRGGLMRRENLALFKEFSKQSEGKLY